MLVLGEQETSPANISIRVENSWIPPSPPTNWSETVLQKIEKGGFSCVFLQKGGFYPVFTLETCIFRKIPKSFYL